METVVVVLMILVSFNFLLKLTYCKLWTVAVVSVLTGLFTGFMWPLAIEQSKTQISDWLSNPSLMLDTSVILTIEVVLQMSYCMLATHLQTSGVVSKRTLFFYRCLRLFPGVLIFVVLFSVLVTLIFSFPGMSFSLLSWIMGCGVLILIPLGIWGVKIILPEKEVRLELLFLCNAIVAILGIIATVNGTTAVSGISEIDWGASLGLLLIVVAGTILGWGIRVFYMNHKAFKR